MASLINIVDPPDEEVANDALLTVNINNNRDFFRGKEDGSENMRIDCNGHLVTSGGITRHIVSLNLGDIAANSDALVYPIFKPFQSADGSEKIAITVETVTIGVDTTLAASASHYETIALVDGQGNTVVSGTTAAGLTGGAMASLGTVSTTYNDIDPNDSEWLKLTFTKTGNGGALSGFTIQIEFIVKAKDNVSSDTAESDAIIRAINHDDATAIVTIDDTHRDLLDFQKDGKSVFKVDIDGVIKTNSGDQYQYMVAFLGTIDVNADDAKVCSIAIPENDITIKAIAIGVNTTVALSGSANYETIRFLNDALVIAQCTTSGPAGSGLALTAGEMYWLKIANSPNAILTSSDTLKVSFTGTGTGGSDLVGLTVLVVYVRNK